MADRRAPRRLLATCAVVLAAVSAAGAPAAAESRAEVRELVRQARSDPAAVERLRQVDDVDGRPADLRAALEGAEGDDLQRRLDLIDSELSGGAGPAEPRLPGDPADTANRILSSERFRPDEPPRPLRGLIRRLGEFLSPVLDPLGRAFEVVGGALGALARNPVLLVAVVAAVIGATVLLTMALIRRRTRLGTADAGDGTAAAGGPAESNDPRELDRQADAAEAAGDLDLAFRLRFRAGLLRLDRAGVIELRQSATTGQLVRAIRSATFPPLARAFDEVAYGGRTPAAEDLQRAKADWPRVLEEARR